EDGIRDFHVTGVQTCALPISAPAALLRRREPDLGELLAHHRELARRHRQVEGVVAARAALGVEALDRAGQPLERLVVTELARDEIGRASCRESVEISRLL